MTIRLNRQVIGVIHQVNTIENKICRSVYISQIQRLTTVVCDSKVYQVFLRSFFVIRMTKIVEAYLSCFLFQSDLDFLILFKLF